MKHNALNLEEKNFQVDSNTEGMPVVDEELRRHHDKAEGVHTMR